MQQVQQPQKDNSLKILVIISISAIFFLALITTLTVAAVLAKNILPSQNFLSFFKIKKTKSQLIPTPTFNPKLPTPTPSLPPSPTSTPTPLPLPTSKPTEPPPDQYNSNPNPYNTTISEQELWNALVAVRQANKRNDIQKDERLCVYARKRVAQHLERLKTIPPGQNPLDHHEGFINDPNKWSQTGFSRLSENLAYTPGYTSAAQIIEWGWDQSPGHKENQLSNQHSHACIVGTHPFYVTIFGSNP